MEPRSGKIERLHSGAIKFGIARRLVTSDFPHQKAFKGRHFFANLQNAFPSCLEWENHVFATTINCNSK